ncbi:acetyl-CoA carboxylase biotin carboxylase subunit family protein [Mesorhizobium sp. M0037]|uniref:ATP-grasp domain-containing protein n=1 Tax=unclassified Mesorhizobium TaxID=325217 RepID=UPI00333CC2E7
MAKRAFILLEGHSRGNGLLYVEAAKRLGLYPITLSTNPAQYDYLAAEAMEAIAVDTDNLDALIREFSHLGEMYEIAGIAGFSGEDESVYATVGKLCRHFDLPGPNPESVEQCHDKFIQRQLLSDAGIPVPAYRLAANMADVECSAAEIGLPVIVKPAVGSGSMGVRLCRDLDELAKHTAYLLGGQHKWRSSPRMLVEEFAKGTYYWADTMGDQIIGIGTADYGPPPHFVCRSCTIPAPLTDDEHERIADASLSCLRALGLGWGPAGIEFRWTKRGPVVIEVNPRLHGAPTPQLLQLAYGIDLVTEHINIATGKECDLRRRHSHVAAARFLVADRDGILDMIADGSQGTAVPGVAEVKFYIPPKTSIVRKGDYRDWIGHIIATSPWHTQVEEILQRAVDSLHWSIKHFPTVGE